RGPLALRGRGGAGSDCAGGRQVAQDARVAAAAIERAHRRVAGRRAGRVRVAGDRAAAVATDRAEAARGEGVVWPAADATFVVAAGERPPCRSLARLEANRGETQEGGDEEFFHGAVGSSLRSGGRVLPPS